MRSMEGRPNDRRPGATVLPCVILVLVGLSAQVSAQPASPRKGELHGDWEVQINFKEGRRTSLLSLTRDPEGNPTGEWISLSGVSALADVRREGAKLSFTWKRRNRDGRSTRWEFSGTIEKGGLSGTVSSGGDEHDVRCKRIPPLPAIVGNWAMGYMDLRLGSTLEVQLDKKGKLTAGWRNVLSGNHPLTDFTYEKGKVRFTYDGAAYEGGFRSANGPLHGVMTTERGRIPIVALRVGTALMGSWNLEIRSDGDSRRQRLRILPDMSGWYGATRIKVSVRPPDAVESTVKSASLDGSTVSFKALTKLGGRKFETSFLGTVKGSKLTGEITTSRGRSKVVGKRVIPDIDRPRASDLRP